MARRCKCRVCGKPLTTDSAYRVIVKDKNYYYCNQWEYEEVELAKKRESEHLNKVKDWFDYILRDEGEINWPIVMRLIEELKLGYSIEQIEEYLSVEATDLKAILWNKRFANFFNTLQYLRTVIMNSINEYFELDAEPEKREEIMVSDFYMPETNKYKAKPRRKSMAELEDDEDDDE